MGISTLVTNVWRLSSARRISVEEKWFWTNVAHILLSVNDCYVGRVLDESHINLLGVSSEMRKTYGEVR